MEPVTTTGKRTPDCRSLSLDDKSRSSISMMAAPSVKQSMRTMLEKPLKLVREIRGLLLRRSAGAAIPE
jgi:hypothetical protein